MRDYGVHSVLLRFRKMSRRTQTVGYLTRVQTSRHVFLVRHVFLAWHVCLLSAPMGYGSWSHFGLLGVCWFDLQVTIYYFVGFFTFHRD